MYLLQSEDATQGYIGCDVDLDKRLKQHNGEAGGGEIAPKSGRPWKRIAHIPFNTRNEALKYETAAHNCQPLRHPACSQEYKNEFINYNEFQRKAVQFKWFFKPTKHYLNTTHQFVQNYVRNF